MNQVEFALSGQAVLLRNLEVTVSMRLQDTDQSGQASSTASSQQGIKAKELKITGLIPFDDADQLTLLYQLAEAEESSGQRRRYRVNHDVATTIKFREATFSGDVSASKAGNLQAWQVSFTLREYFSVAEKKAGARAASGSGAVAQTAQGTADATEPPERLTGFELFLKDVNDAIGPR